jgi:hypothetical protein
MARLARVEVFAADEIAIVHVMNRTVRRCRTVISRRSPDWQRFRGNQPERTAAVILCLKVILVLACLPQHLNEHSGTLGTAEPVGIEFI